MIADCGNKRGHEKSTAAHTTPSPTQLKGDKSNFRDACHNQKCGRLLWLISVTEVPRTEAAYGNPGNSNPSVNCAERAVLHLQHGGPGVL